MLKDIIYYRHGKPYIKLNKNQIIKKGAMISILYGELHPVDKKNIFGQKPKDLIWADECEFFNPMEELTAELRNPEMDKNFSIHFYKVSTENRRNIKRVINEIINNKLAPIFLQGDSNNWMMIEFWTDDVDKIIKCCEFIECKLSIEIYGL